MRLPRKSQDKTMTRHACVLCDLMNYCMMVCMSYCMYDVNVCVLRQIEHRCWKTNFGSLQCVNWKDKIKEIKILEIYLVHWIMKSNSNKFEVEH